MAQLQITTFYRQNQITRLAGNGEVREAFNDRDVSCLENALKKYPGAWQNELCVVDKKGDVQDIGTLSHLAIMIKWNEALEILMDGGDPMNIPHADTGHSPLGTAIACGNIRAVDWILAQSIEEDPNARAPMEALTKCTDNRINIVNVAKKLLKAGCNPWQVASSGREMPHESIRSGQLDLAILFLENGHAQGHLFEDPIHQDWFRAISIDHDPATHIKILNALHTQGRSPSVLKMAQHYQLLSKKCTSPTSPYLVKIEAFSPLIERRILMGTDALDALDALSVFNQCTEHMSAQLRQEITELQHLALTSQTPVATNNTGKLRL